MEQFIGRRVERYDQLDFAGDYCGPYEDDEADPATVFFLLPTYGDLAAPRSAQRVHHVTSPPHVFRECADGSLEIRESIGALDDHGGPYVWHGFLDCGHVWRSM